MTMRVRFSLLELATALAVLGILAAMSIPAFADAQYKSMASEVTLVVDGIWAAVDAYDDVYDAPVLLPSHPVHPLGRDAYPWMPAPREWEGLGYRSDGAVRGIYSVSVKNDIVQGILNVDRDYVAYTQQRNQSFASLPPVLIEVCINMLGGPPLPPPCY